MAKMLEIPVTTVQYWWEKGVIPRGRQVDVLNILNKNGIAASPSDLFDYYPNGKTK